MGETFPREAFQCLSLRSSSCQLEKVTIVVCRRHPRQNHLARFAGHHLEKSISACSLVTLPRAPPGALTQHSGGIHPSSPAPVALCHGGILSERWGTPREAALTGSWVVGRQQFGCASHPSGMEDPRRPTLLSRDDIPKPSRKAPPTPTIL